MLDYNDLATDWYKAGFLSAEDLKVWVVVGTLTQEQFTTITGQVYTQTV